MWKLYIRNKTNTNLENYKKLEKETKKEVQKAKRNMDKQLANKQNLRGFYTYVNSKSKTKDRIGPLRQDDNIITESKQQADLLNSYFSSVFTNERLDYIPEPNNRTYTQPVETAMFSIKAVSDKIKTFKPSPTILLLQQYVSQLSNPLSKICTSSLEFSIVPQSWREANITPIFKKGVKGDPGNYRPISLTSVPCNIMEAITKIILLNT